MKTFLATITFFLMIFITSNSVLAQADEDDYIEESEESVEIEDYNNLDNSILCNLTQKLDAPSTQLFIDEYGLTQGVLPSIMNNTDRGIYVLDDNGISSIEFDTDKYDGYLPIIRSNNYSKSEIMQLAPNEEVQPYENAYIFYYYQLIKITLSFNEDNSSITNVKYEPVQFVKFNNECFNSGIMNQVENNHAAYRKLSLLYRMTDLFTISDRNFAEYSQVVFDEFGTGTVKDNIYALKLYSGITKEQVDYQFEEIRCALREVDFGFDIIFNPPIYEEKLPVGDDLKSIISELTQINVANVSEFSYSLTVSSSKEHYHSYRGNSLNLLIHPTEEDSYDLLLVGINN